MVCLFRVCDIKVSVTIFRTVLGWLYYIVLFYVKVLGCTNDYICLMLAV